MQFLAEFTLVAAIASGAAKFPADESLCGLDSQVASIGEGYHSLIHRHTVRELSHFSRLSSKFDVGLASHRQGRDAHVRKFSRTNYSQDDLHQALQGLQQHLDALGYPIVEGYVRDDNPYLAKEAFIYDQWANTLNLSTICETGFNAGHSALRFLAQSQATVYEFDLCEHPYTQPAAAYLSSKYPGRLHLTCGDSAATLPAFRSSYPAIKCDLIIVDGGHSFEAAESDLFHLAKMASENAVVSMDDTPCSASWCDGPNRAWADFAAKGCIVNESKNPMAELLGFTFARVSPCTYLQEAA
mmetsp:Transcript_70913/g.122913  ORF Transcript_70913/g.122913 Transcript_70913/m.122913 type:complete len:299 (+) Transcript_70913:98-994(+)